MLNYLVPHDLIQPCDYSAYAWKKQPLNVARATNSKIIFYKVSQVLSCSGTGNSWPEGLTKNTSK